MKKLKNYFIILFCFLALELNGAQKTTEELLKLSQQEYEKENFYQSYENAHLALVGIFEKMPLTLTNFILIDEPADGYGIYSKRESNSYKASDPIYIYCEPKGYTFKRNGKEYQFAIVTDFYVTDNENNIIGGQKGFGQFEFISQQPSMEFLLNLTYSLNGLEPGSYQIHTTAKDPYSGKNRTETIEIKIIN